MDAPKQPFYPVARAEPDDNKAAQYGRFGRDFFELCLRAVPWVVRFGNTLRVMYPVAKTDVTARNTVLVTSNEATAYAGLVVRLTGGAAQANRVVDLQTFENGVANAGTLILQPVGGTVTVPVGTVTSQLNTYHPTGADLMNATPITAGTWTDLATVTSGFTPASAASQIWVSVRGACNITSAAGNPVSARLIVDGATTFGLAGCITGPATSYVNPVGGAMLPIGTWAASNHTLKVQVWCLAAATGYCRVNTQTNFEWLYVDVWEVRS